jgi:hypothetical protein
MAVSISEGEVARRVAIVKRFRELLTEQRDRFRSYIAVLDKQQVLIGSGNTEELTAHVELEEQIAADIFSIQKVIDPLEDMYNAAAVNVPGNEIPSLKAALEDLKTRALIRCKHNRNLLSGRMADIRTEIKELRNSPFASNAGRALYQNMHTASLVDIRG